MPRLELADASLDYDVVGERGPLAVQLHGLTSSRVHDAQLGLDLGRALHEHRVLRYDARGHGRSSGAPNARAYLWDRLAVDLLALLDHVAPGERVHGVGHSMGTATLLHAAVRDPQRFASLTLVVPPTVWETRRAQAASYLVGAEVAEGEGLAAFVERGRDAPAPPAIAGAPAALPSVAEPLLPAVLRGAAASDLPAPEAVAGIAVPTLILAWSDDPSHPLSTAQRLHALIRGSRLAVARTPAEIMSWPALFAEHVTRNDPPAEEGA